MPRSFSLGSSTDGDGEEPEEGEEGAEEGEEGEDPPGLQREKSDGTKLQDVKTVEYEQLYRMGLVVIQELQKRVEALEAKVG